MTVLRARYNLGISGLRKWHIAAEIESREIFHDATRLGIYCQMPVSNYLKYRYLLVDLQSRTLGHRYIYPNLV